MSETLPPPPIPLLEIAKRHGVHATTVRRWVLNKSLCPVGGFKTPVKPLRFAVSEVVKFEQGGAK